MEENKKVEENQEKESFLGFIIIVIAIILLGVGIGLLIVMPNESGFGDKKPSNSSSSTNTNVEENNNTEIVENTENNTEVVENTENGNENTEQVMPVDYTITKEEVETFINDIVPSTYREDILLDNPSDNNTLFIRCLKYLVFNEKYTKDGETFIFNISDFKDTARKYFMKEDFELPENVEGTQITIDNEAQTAKMLINFGLSDPGPEFTKEKGLTDFSFENGVADVKYVTKVVNTIPLNENGETKTEENINTYQIKLIKVNDELRIKELSYIE